MKGTIKFELKSGVKAKYGKLPISMIYSVAGQRKRFSPGITIHKEYWNNEDQRLAFIPQKIARKLLPDINPHLLLTEIDVRDINNILNKLVSDIHNIETRFKSNRVEFTSTSVIDELLTGQVSFLKKQEDRNMLFDFMNKYIHDHEATREKGSLSVYKSVKNHLQAYQDETKDKVRFDSIDYGFFQRFRTFLIRRTKTDKAGKISPMLNNTTIAKALSTLKTFLNYAKKQGIKVNDNYSSFSIKKEKLEIIALEQWELNAIIDLDLANNKRLDKARDLFCFSCATGLRYSDVAQITREQIRGRAIHLVVKKTKSELRVPLNPLAWSILDKYKDQHKPLPVISNQNLNYYIKEVCQLAEINTLQEIVRYRGTKREVTTYPKYELIHSHTGRKTFVTLSLEKGMSAETIMATTGHVDYRSFQRYAATSERHKDDQMDQAWGNIPIVK
jgi:integrase